MRLLILEDEPLLAEALKREIISADPTLTVVATLGSIREALAWWEQHAAPDLIFSDIELNDGLSFEIFKRLDEVPPVIFCTAYNHYAAQAFQANGVDYILKPLDPAEITAALLRFRARTNTPSAPDYAALAEFVQQKQQRAPRNLLVRRGEHIIPVPITQIILAEIKHGIVYVRTRSGERYALSQNIEQTAATLGPEFIRANRQILIARGAIKHVSPYFGRKLLVEPNFQYSERIVVSKAGASEFLRKLEAG